MPIRFNNDFTKHWLARKGPPKVFGKDVDTRERLSDAEAVTWFDKVWVEQLQRSVELASSCDIDFVRGKVPKNAQQFIDESASHREFTLANCFFICQLIDPQTCDQLWFIPSASGDPRTLDVKFDSVPTKEAFDNLAKDLGWHKPEELGEKLLLDFLESVSRKTYRAAEHEQRWGLEGGTCNDE